MTRKINTTSKTAKKNTNTSIRMSSKRMKRLRLNNSKRRISRKRKHAEPTDSQRKLINPINKKLKVTMPMLMTKLNFNKEPFITEKCLTTTPT